MIEKWLPCKRFFATPGKYRIRVGGVIDPSWSDWLGGMTITTWESRGTPVTDLVGELTDQAALAGVLDALFEMQLPLLRVECLCDNE